jgi:DNA polymerase III epsilon subunit
MITRVINCGIVSLHKTQGSAFNIEEWKENKILNKEWIDKDNYYKLEILKHKRAIGEINRRLGWGNPISLFSEGYVLEEDRKIILDTETTGLYDSDGIVEISMIETYKNIKTGRFFHSFFNPLIHITSKASAIHKLTDDSVSNFPVFGDKVKEILDFIGNSYIVAHNASFDMRMLNNELLRWNFSPIPRSHFIDTLSMARFLYPNQGNRQDDLCVRFNIDNKLRMETGIHSAIEYTIHLYKIFSKLCKEMESSGKTEYDFVLSKGKKRKLS